LVSKIKWGILATGDIARKFATGLQLLPDAEIIAVGSRSQKGADEFAGKFGIPHRHASYEALANDPEVEVIYVATPNSLHKDNCLMCLEAGKAVVCEKPFMVNAHEATLVANVARKLQKFLMEAMWTRFIPAVQQARAWVDSGEIGEVRMVEAGFGYREEKSTTAVDHALAGGSLLDVGVYPLAIADLAFGRPPERIASFAHVAHGIDEQAAFILGYSGGGLALLHSAVRTRTFSDAHIMGDQGMIRLHGPFWRSQKVSLLKPGRDELMVDCPITGNGYNYEAAAVMDCLRSGNLEHPLMPLSKTIEIMEIMDEIRDQWGLYYPMETRHG